MIVNEGQREYAKLIEERFNREKELIDYILRTTYRQEFCGKYYGLPNQKTKE